MGKSQKNHKSVPSVDSQYLSKQMSAFIVVTKKGHEQICF